ncbi:MAG TPA: hypothetical protein VLM79_10490 [Kofleriaceae bacterium]|nr:hypothetical protein [Kofleriaceae bacterium]
MAAQGQRDATGDVSIAALLEQRVPEELAVEGVMLSRRGLTLQVEQFGTRLLVSLVDRRTGRVAASTKIDRLSEDRDAAVAITTHVVADMVAEISERIAPAPPVPPPALPPAPNAIVEPKAAIAQSIDTEPPYTEPGEATESDPRAAAELRFRRESVGFGNDLSVYMVLRPDRYVAATGRHWYPYQGELKKRLKPEAFYKLVGRRDLADAYDRRSKTMLALRWGGGVLAVGSGLAWIASLQSDGQKLSYLQTGALVGLAAGVAAAAAGRWLQESLDPISESEARTIAEQYNKRLRRSLGLPLSARMRRDVHVLPYAGSHDAGLAIATAF